MSFSPILVRLLTPPLRWPRSWTLVLAPVLWLFGGLAVVSLWQLALAWGLAGQWQEGMLPMILRSLLSATIALLIAWLAPEPRPFAAPPASLRDL